MTSSIASLIASGTKLWLDSVDPELVAQNIQLGATGATSNPIIISELVKSGRFDRLLSDLVRRGDCTPTAAAWKLTDHVVSAAQEAFLPVWEQTGGNDGYVSFEVDPLLEDPASPLSHDQRVAQYLEEATKWSTGHRNRMIKVPATPAGIAALPELASRGIPLNVTLIFTMRQYQAARDAIWEGAQRLAALDKFKSVYSIFVSRVDVYTQQHVPQLSAAAQGMVGILNAQRIWQCNQQFWGERQTPLRQEIVFASTGTKNPADPPWKYVAALAGSDIQTNPPATNAAVAAADLEFSRSVDRLPPAEVVAEIDSTVDMQALEEFLVAEGIKKFADPQKALLALIEEKSRQLTV